MTWCLSRLQSGVDGNSRSSAHHSASTSLCVITSARSHATLVFNCNFIWQLASLRFHLSFNILSTSVDFASMLSHVKMQDAFSLSKTKLSRLFWGVWWRLKKLSWMLQWQQFPSRATVTRATVFIIGVFILWWTPLWWTPTLTVYLVNVALTRFTVATKGLEKQKKQKQESIPSFHYSTAQQQQQRGPKFKSQGEIYQCFSAIIHSIFYYLILYSLAMSPKYCCLCVNFNRFSSGENHKPAHWLVNPYGLIS